ncbi:PepSY-like domain-containing protein [Myxococcus sp. K38C18041901]|uniref:PepSY-like domain-containing protein n=1 Tax=Myxococcus guangdongensis TaxID=2906760 RepID=UPI0020A6E815|nr:PepSY-like domain-containing protein [Myxococcus guangdongensis]MCP3064196.1 PepSY-like domain-containing protein [Myxococcus guangdongensis]
MKTWKMAVMGTLAMMGAVGPAWAKDVAVQPSDVPAAVKATVASKYPDAKAQRFSMEEEKGQQVYEVVFDSGAHKVEASLTADGTLLSEERTLTRQELPAEVGQSLAKSPYASARVQRIEKETKGDTVRYELIVEQQGRKQELVFDGQGKLLEHGRDAGKHPGGQHGEEDED